MLFQPNRAHYNRMIREVSCPCHPEQAYQRQWSGAGLSIEILCEFLAPHFSHIAPHFSHIELASPPDVPFSRSRFVKCHRCVEFRPEASRVIPVPPELECVRAGTKLECTHVLVLVPHPLENLPVWQAHDHWCSGTIISNLREGDFVTAAAQAYLVDQHGNLLDGATIKISTGPICPMIELQAPNGLKSPYGYVDGRFVRPVAGTAATDGGSNGTAAGGSNGTAAVVSAGGSDVTAALHKHSWSYESGFVQRSFDDPGTVQSATAERTFP